MEKHSSPWHSRHRSAAGDARRKGYILLTSLLRPGAAISTNTIYNEQAVAYEIRTWVWDVAKNNTFLFEHTEGYGVYPSDHLIAKIMLVAV